MNLNELKVALEGMDKIQFSLPDGSKVPAHFHLTEIGKISKHFMDCGGKERLETKASLQLWSSIDFHHRLKAEKMIRIVEMSQEKLGLSDEEIEVEYQGETIGKYGLEVGADGFVLTSTNTACLAQEDCAIPVVVKNIKEAASNCCSPASGCC